MTASTDSDENSHPSKDLNSPAPQGFIFDDANPPEPESSYVPEREFVLMPLFRRIGELLGVNRGRVSEYHDEPVQEEPPIPSTAAVMQDLDPLAETSHFIEDPSSERLLEMNQGVTESIDFQQESAPEPEAPVFFAPLEATPRAAAPLEQPSPPFEPLAEVEPPEATSSYAQVSLGEGDPSARPQTQSVDSRRRSEEIGEMMAPLREAVAKISAAISQAAEWLRTKEEEILRRAELSLGTAKPAGRAEAPATDQTLSVMAQAPSQDSAAEDAEAIASANALEGSSESTGLPTWESLEAPGLQREWEWRERSESGPAEQLPPPVQPVYHGVNAEGVQNRPALVGSLAPLPFWKRIDLARLFTPTSIAVLGGATMAILIVAGISLARRPASDILPQQTRVVQPGGVTLSTHPADPATKARAAQPARRSLSPAQRSQAAGNHRARRAAALDDGPDVVTHYYRQKPSPVRQSTVAGVRHYSDMN